MENQGSKRGKTIFSIFKPSEQTSTNKGHSPFNVDVSNRNDQPPLKSQRVEIDVNTLERDLGIRIPLWQHSINQQDEIRRAYIKMGPYQPKLVEYPMTETVRQYRWFHSTLGLINFLCYSTLHQRMWYFVFHALSLKTKCLVNPHSPPKALKVGRGLMMGLYVHFWYMWEAPLHHITML